MEAVQTDDCPKPPLLQGQGSDRQRWRREEAAAKLAAYQVSAGTGGERERALQLDVPRATVRGWAERAAAEPDVVAQFFSTPAGVALLARIMVAAAVTIMYAGASGIRVVQMFLRLSQLSRHVASSYGALHSYSRQVTDAMLAYEERERSRLATTMAAKAITACLDETFHPDICLVGIEPVSGFILVENYSKKRDAASWDAAMEKGLAGLNVDVIQVTSDQAKAIRHHVQETLGAQPSPDIFHIQHEIAKSLAAPLNAQVREAEHAFQEAAQRVVALETEHRQWEAEPRRGRPPDYPGRIASARHDAQGADVQRAKTVDNKDMLREVISGISQGYHPFDLQTGERRTASVITECLAGLFAKAKQLVDDAKLPSRCSKAVDKAAALVEEMTDAVHFFHWMTTEYVGTLALPTEVQAAILALLIPALYLQRVAKKAPWAMTREQLQTLAHTLLSKFEAVPAWASLDEPPRILARQTAQWCAELFQRSSSCVEGRNGRLSLHHHGIHRLRGDKLRCLTIIHNYFLEHPDGSTAAERFFGAAPDSLVDYLVTSVNTLARPALRRAVGSRPYDA